MSLESLKGKKLLILAGAGVHCKVVKAAKELGIYTIVTDYLEDSPAKALADEAWMYDIKDIESIVRKCKEEHVDGVMNFCIDPAQIPYQAICERLNLPCIGTRKTFEILTDKKKFKEYCRMYNVDVIPDYSEEDIVNDEVEYPIFIKPTNSRGSRGQSICNSKEEALRGIEKAKKESTNGTFVCEKYMGGHQDTGAAFFVVNGVPHLVKFADRHLGKKEDGLDKQVICTKLPSLFSGSLEKYVLDRVKVMINSLDIKFGPVFLQGFVDGNTIRYYDPAQRMPGGDYDLVLKRATGFDTVKTWIHYALTGDVDFTVGNPAEAYKLNGRIGLLITVSVRPGFMAKIEGMGKVLSHPDVVYGRQIIEPGVTIPDSGDIKQRVAAIGVLLKDQREIKPFMDFFYDTYHVLDALGNDMIISRWEYKTV